MPGRPATRRPATRRRRRLGRAPRSTMQWTTWREVALLWRAATGESLAAQKRRIGVVNTRGVKDPRVPARLVALSAAAWGLPVSVLLADPAECRVAAAMAFVEARRLSSARALVEG